MIDYTQPPEVRWGLQTLEQWTDDAVRQVAVHQQEIDKLKDELENDRPICWEPGCPGEPVVCRVHYEAALVEAKEAD